MRGGWDVYPMGGGGMGASERWGGDGCDDRNGLGEDITR